MAKKTPAAKKVLAAKKAGTTAAAKKAASKKTAKQKAAKQNEKIDYEKRVGLDLAFIGSKDEVAETRNVASRLRVRTELQSEVEKFLQTGGMISNIKPNVMADPPKKPESNYGSRPI